MTDEVTCPVCKSKVARLPIMGEMVPPEFDDLGVPIACAVSSGFGVPVVQPGSWAVAVDGVPLKRCVAFDRRAGAAWHFAEGPDGNVIVIDGEAYVERIDGIVTVQPVEHARQPAQTPPRAASLEDRAWNSLSAELGLPAAARATLKGTFLFKRRVLQIALDDFAGALAASAPGRLIDRALDWLSGNRR